MVTIGMYPAVHPGCVVADDASYHCTVHRGRVGRKDPSPGLEDGVHAPTHDAWLHADGLPLVGHFISLPVLSRYDEDGIAQALPGQGGSCCSEGVGHLILGTSLDNSRDLFLRIGTDYDFGYNSVKTGICSPSESSQGVGV